MRKRDELIEKYADDLKNKCGMKPDMDFFDNCYHWMWAFNLECGCVHSCWEPRERVGNSQNNFLIKKLG